MKYMELTAAKLAGINRNQTLVIIPIAAVEQHGPHMPTGTDTILCTAVAEAVESALRSQVLLTPTTWMGASAHHLRLGSTLDSSLDTYIETLFDTARSLLNDNYRRVLFLNGHGGNIDPMRVAVRKLQAIYTDSLIAAGCYWDPILDQIGQVLEGEHKFVGHACEFETSMMLHVRPELVETHLLEDAGELVTDSINGTFLGRDMRHRTRNGFTGRPDLASDDKGARLFNMAVEGVLSTAKELLAQPLGKVYSDFVD